MRASSRRPPTTRPCPCTWCRFRTGRRPPRCGGRSRCPTGDRTARPTPLEDAPTAITFGPVEALSVYENAGSKCFKAATVTPSNEPCSAYSSWTAVIACCSVVCASTSLAAPICEMTLCWSDAICSPLPFMNVMNPTMSNTTTRPAATSATMRPRPEPASARDPLGRGPAGSERLRDGLPNAKESSIPAGIGTRATI